MRLAFTSACFAGLPKRLLFFFATSFSLNPEWLATARCLWMFSKPLLVHGCALAYFRGNLTDYEHAWTGMNYLPQAPQSSALPSCATARRPISTGQENVTGLSTSLAVGHNPSTARTHSHVAHRLAKRVGHAPGDSDATVTRQALEPMRWSRSNLEYRR